MAEKANYTNETEDSKECYFFVGQNQISSANSFQLHYDKETNQLSVNSRGCALELDKEQVEQLIAFLRFSIK